MDILKIVLLALNQQINQGVYIIFWEIYANNFQEHIFLLLKPAVSLQNHLDLPHGINYDVYQVNTIHIYIGHSQSSNAYVFPWNLQQIRRAQWH